MINREESQATYRILDASANRAFEGIRTLEEFARFVLDDASLAEPLKSLRHELALALEVLSRKKLLQARDTSGDVGTELKTRGEYQRPNAASVVAAAASRLQQALRCLEEYGKTISMEMAIKIESLRYRSYDLCAQLELVCLTANPNREKLRTSCLYVLCDGATDEDLFSQRLKQCVDGGVDVIQLRDRRLTDRQLLERAEIAVALLRDSQVLFIVNDRVDIAVACGADGVHVGQDELTVEAVRKVAGNNLLVGVSTHSIDQARQAVIDGADYIGVGPCFPSQTKSFDSFVGTELLKQVSQEIAIAAFAIGGVSLENVVNVVNSGINRIAVSAAVCGASDVIGAARELSSQLRAGASRADKSEDI